MHIQIKTAGQTMRVLWGIRGSNKFFGFLNRAVSIGQSTPVHDHRPEPVFRLLFIFKQNITIFDFVVDTTIMARNVRFRKPLLQSTLGIVSIRTLFSNTAKSNVRIVYDACSANIKTGPLIATYKTISIDMELMGINQYHTSSGECVITIISINSK